MKLAIHNKLSLSLVFYCMLIGATQQALQGLGISTKSVRDIKKTTSMIMSELEAYKKKADEGFKIAKFENPSIEDAPREPGSTSFGAYGTDYAWSEAWKLKTVNAGTIVCKANPQKTLRFAFETDDGGKGVFGLNGGKEARPPSIELTVTTTSVQATTQKQMTAINYNENTGAALQYSRPWLRKIESKTRQTTNPLESPDGYYWVSLSAKTQHQYTTTREIIIEYGVGKNPGQNIRYKGALSESLDNDIVKFSLGTGPNEYVVFSDIKSLEFIDLTQPGHATYSFKRDRGFFFHKTKWRLPETNKGVIRFKTSGAEILIALEDDASPDQMGSSIGKPRPRYRIALGYSGNTRHFIDGLRDSEYYISPDVSAKLPVEGAPKFDYDLGQEISDEIAIWVRFDNGDITVGTGDSVGKNQILSWKDPQPNKQITRFSLSGNHQNRTFSDITVDKAEAIPGKETYTAETANVYRWSDNWKFPAKNNGAAVFSTNGSDFSIGLSDASAQEQSQPRYIVNIGAENNSKILFKQMSGDTQSVLKSVDFSIANTIGDQTYWVQSDGSELSVGKGTTPGENLFAYCSFSTDISLEKIAFSTDTTHAKIFKNISLKNARTIRVKEHTITRGKWDWLQGWKTDQTDKLAITFTAKNTDLKVGLANKANTNNLQYIIQLGASNNTLSWVHKKQSDNSWSTPYEATQGMSPNGTQQKYWLQLRDGIIAFGSGSNVGSNIIGYYKDTTPVTGISHFSFSHSSTENVQITDINTIALGTVIEPKKPEPTPEPKPEPTPEPKTETQPTPAESTKKEGLDFTQPGHSTYSFKSQNGFLFHKTKWRLPETNKGVIRFKTSDAEILIALEDDASPDQMGSGIGKPRPRYRIALGYNGNTRHLIDGLRNGEYYISPDVNAKLPAGENAIWVRFDNGDIAVGTGNVVGKNQIISWKDPQPNKQITRFSLSGNYHDRTFSDITIDKVEALPDKAAATPEKKAEAAPDKETPPPAKTEQPQSKESHASVLLKKLVSQKNSIDKLIILYKIITDKRVNGASFADTDYAAYITEVKNLTAECMFLKDDLQSSDTDEIYAILKSIVAVLHGDAAANALSKSKKPLEILGKTPLTLLQHIINGAYYDPVGFSTYSKELLSLFNETTTTQLNERISLYGTQLKQLTDDKQARTRLWRRITSLTESNSKELHPSFVITDEQLLESYKINDGKTYSLQSLYTALTNGSIPLTADDTRDLKPFTSKIALFDKQLNGAKKQLEALSQALSEKASDAASIWIKQMKNIFNELKISSLASDKEAVVAEIKKAAWYSIDLFDDTQKNLLKEFVGKIQYNSGGIFSEQSNTAPEINTIISASDRNFDQKIKYYNTLIHSAEYYSPLIFATILAFISKLDHTTLTKEMIEKITTQLITPLTPQAKTESEKTALTQITTKMGEVEKQTESFSSKLLQLKAESDRNNHYTILDSIITNIEQGTITTLNAQESEALLKEFELAAAVASIDPNDDYNKKTALLMQTTATKEKFKSSFNSSQIEVMNTYASFLTTPFSAQKYSQIQTIILPTMIARKDEASGEVSRYFLSLKEQTSGIVGIDSSQVSDSASLTALNAFKDKISSYSAELFKDDERKKTLTDYITAVTHLAKKSGNFQAQNAVNPTGATTFTSGLISVPSSGLGISRKR